jgi:hypothetical protein
VLALIEKWGVNTSASMSGRDRRSHGRLRVR